MEFTLTAIGIIHSCYKDKFAIPRQSGLVSSATAQIELLPPYNDIEATRGLDEFSHLWLSFIFHRHTDKGWHPTVQPPRLDGKQRMGVFATRASFRPNPIGLSLVELVRIEQQGSQIFIHVKGADLLDKTPIIDIKPYLPYADSNPDAKSGFTETINDQALNISFSDKALAECEQISTKYPKIKEFVEQLLSLDHRPYYFKKIEKVYSTQVYEYDLKWIIKDNHVEVLSLIKADN